MLRKLLAHLHVVLVEGRSSQHFYQLIQVENVLVVKSLRHLLFFDFVW